MKCILYRIRQMINLLKTSFNELKKMMADAEEMGRNANESPKTDKKEKWEIIVLCFLVILGVAFLYFFRTYLSVALGIILLALLFGILDFGDSNSAQVSTEVDLTNIHELVYEAVCESALLIGVDTPASPRRMVEKVFPLSDGELAMEYRLRKRHLEEMPDKNELLEKKEILQSEMDRTCSQTELPFFSDIQGLFLVFIKDVGYYYKIGVIPVNPRTQGRINRMKRNEFNERSKEKKTPALELKSEIQIRPFLKKQVWERSGLKSSLSIDLDRYPHTLIVGATGSGKTYALKVIATSLVDHYSDCQLYLCDFKGQDYEFLKSSERYFSHIHYGSGIEKFYEKLFDRISGKDITVNRCLLVVDEWNNFISLLDTKKEQDGYLKMIASILHMGRSYKMNVLLGSQVGHAEFFGKARNSFSSYIGLGQLDKESISMLFYEQKEQIKPQPRGSGYLLQDGKPVEEIIVPEVQDISALEEILIKAIQR